MADDTVDTLYEKIRGVRQRYITDDETLRLTVHNAAASVRVRVAGRRCTVDGRINEFGHELVPTTDRLATNLDVQLGEGWILGLAVRVISGSPLDGQTYAVVQLGNGSGAQFSPLDVLCADTITAARRLAWPGSPIRGPLDGAGAIRSITGTTPAAGAEISETVPTGARWMLVSFQFRFVTAVAVANRVPILVVDDGANAFVRSSLGANIPASNTVDVLYGQGINDSSAIFDATLNGPLPVNLFVPSAGRIRTTTTGIQAADQYSLVQYLVIERIEGN